jgi:signal transduction histidine kinase
VGYRNTTIEALAADQLRTNLILTALVLCCLVLGLGLTLRAIGREAKLAELKSAFVSNVSHEMKTPLALIRMFAETLELGRVKSAEKMQEYFRVIHNESRRLSQLIDNILDFAKMEAGRREYQFAPGDVAEVVESVLRSYEDQITSAGFDLAVDLEPRLPAVLMDANALSQAVLNILSNAVKYSAGVKKIRVSVSRCGEHVAIEVADSGIGIPRSEHARIFEKFHRVSAPLVHNTKGSGLGLTLCKHIVEAHGGRILVESAPAQGSRFTILLPVALAVEAPPEAVSKLEEHAFAEGVDRRG